MAKMPSLPEDIMANEDPQRGTSPLYNSFLMITEKWLLYGSKKFAGWVIRGLQLNESSNVGMKRVWNY